MPEGYLKERNLFEKIDLLTEPVPPEVQEWADFQRQASIIERRKTLDDNDIFYSLINLFHRIDVERLTDKDAMQYAEIADRYGVLTDTC